jgi:RNA-binding protein
MIAAIYVDIPILPRRGGYMSNRKKELIKRGVELKPTVHVGKGGITDGIVEEIVRQIKDKHLVKVKLLPSFDVSREDAAAELAEKAKAGLVDVRGNMVLLCDKRLFQ